MNVEVKVVKALLAPPPHQYVTLELYYFVILKLEKYIIYQDYN